jgi:anti-sigma regulatory factor (Ser/Thr protein kinase)
MEPETRSVHAGEFCLVLTPTLTAPLRASEAVWERFAALTEEVRRELAAVVAELVSKAIEHGQRSPITVAIGLTADAIHGEVTSQWAVPEGSIDTSFEIPLAR